MTSRDGAGLGGGSRFQDAEAFPSLGRRFFHRHATDEDRRGDRDALAPAVFDGPVLELVLVGVFQRQPFRGAAMEAHEMANLHRGCMLMAVPPCPPIAQCEVDKVGERMIGAAGKDLTQRPLLEFALQAGSRAVHSALIHEAPFFLAIHGRVESIP